MITPIIMESDIEVVKQKLAILHERRIEVVHFDIGDGLFSDLLTIAPADLQQCDLSNLRIDIHLLVDDPTEWIEESVALRPIRLIGQIERMGSQSLFLETVASYEVKTGLALELATPIEEIEIEALSKCDVVLLLAVPAGTSGSSFDEMIIGKISALRKIYKGSILLDGGINKKTHKLIIEVGATEAAANSAFWRGEI